MVGAAAPPEDFKDLLDKLKAEYERVQQENQCFRKRLKELGEDSPCPQDVSLLDLGSPIPDFDLHRTVSGWRPIYALSFQEQKKGRRPSEEKQEKQVRLKDVEQSGGDTAQDDSTSYMVPMESQLSKQSGGKKAEISMVPLESQQSMRSRKSQGCKKAELADAWTGAPKIHKQSRYRKKKSWEGIELSLPANPNFRKTSLGVMRHLVLLPSSVFNMAWKAVQMLLLTVDLVLIPLRVCFDCRESNIFFLLYFATAFWTLDIAVSACTASVDREGRLEKRLHRMVLRYCKHRFLPDLICLSIEWAFFLKVKNSKGSSEAGLLKFLYWARLLKVIKMRMLMRTLSEHIRSNITLTMFSLLKIMALTLFLTHVVACGWQAAMDPAGALAAYDNPYERYAIALHFAFAQYGLGATDYKLQTSGEHLYSNFVSAMFVLVFPMFVGYSVTCMGTFRQLLKAREQHEQHLREYLRRHQVTWTLRNRIWIFLHKHDREHLLESSVELVQRMPNSLIFELRLEVFVPILKFHPFFHTYAFSRQGNQPYGLYDLVETRAVTECSLKANDELFAEGDKALAMHFLVQGTLLYTCNMTRSFTVTVTTRHEPRSRLFADIGDGDDVCKVDSDGADVTQIHPGDWLGEPALWLKWHHMGFAEAKTHCELVVLEAEKFQTSMRTHVPEAVEYAQRYLQYFRERAYKMNDQYHEKEILRNSAEEIFHPKIGFDINECWPGAVSKWHPSTRRDFQQAWSTVWKVAHTTHPPAMIKTMHIDMKNDAVLIYQTLFAQNCANGQPCDFLTEKEIAEHDKRVLFLKRLLLCFAISRITFSSGGPQQPWPFPLAAAVCHGGRVLVHLIGVSWEELVSFLLHGDLDWDWDNGTPEPIYERMAASHKVKMDRSGSLREVKVNGMSAISQNKRSNFGMDLPVGGLGNPAPVRGLGSPADGYTSGQLCIGPAGTPFRRSRTGRGVAYAKEIQHGHLYLRIDDFSETMTFEGGAEHDSSRRACWGRAETSNYNATATDSASSEHTSRTTRTTHEGWSRVQKSATMTVEALEETLRINNKHELASSAEHLTLLHEQLQRELVLEKNATTHELRCRGMLVHLLIVIEGSDNAEERFLAHGSAVGTTDFNWAAEHNQVQQRPSQITALKSQVIRQLSSSPTNQTRKDMTNFEDISPIRTTKSNLETTFSSESQVFTTNREYEDRVLTVLCMNDEMWTVAVARYCQQVLQLPDSTVEKILNGCHDEDSVETFSWTCDPSPTICHHHMKVCEGKLDLKYTAVRLKTRLKEQDWVGTSSSGSFTTFEKVPELWGFSSVWVSEESDEVEQDYKGPGFVQRTWKWIPTAEAEDMDDAPGLHRPEECCNLRLKRTRQSSMLIGIECSAPFKTDLFGNQHTPDAKSKAISAFGKRKWRDYETEGQCIPAALGGMRCTVTEDCFQQLQDMCFMLGLSKPSDGYSRDQEDEKELFKQIVSGSDEGLQDAIDHAIGMHASRSRGVTGHSSRMPSSRSSGDRPSRQSLDEIVECV